MWENDRNTIANGTKDLFDLDLVGFLLLPGQKAKETSSELVVKPGKLFTQKKMTQLPYQVLVDILGFQQFFCLFLFVH